MAITRGRKPTSETGIYLSKHKHSWAETGAKLWPVGTWHPVFRCMRCGDVICDLSVEVDAPSPTGQTVPSTFAPAA